MNMLKDVAFRRVHVPGIALAAAYFLILLVTARSVGYCRDEGFYFQAARSYQEWFDVLVENPGLAVQEQTISRYWTYNNEHPALMKVLFGFSNRVFSKQLGVLSPSTSFRVPGMLAAAITVYVIFLWGTCVFGARAGLFASLAFAFLPRVFFHAHLACFDIPITAMWLLVCYLYWRSLSSWKFGLASGFAFSLAICVKLNAFFLPLVLGVHYLILFVSRRLEAGGVSKPAPKPWAFLFGLGFAPPIFILHWPWLWHDTWARLVKYVGFHASHAYYNTAWFGENIIQAPTPWLLPLVMTLFTVPTVLVLLSIGGATARLRHHLPERLEQRVKDLWPPAGSQSSNGLDLLLFISAIFPIALISLPSVPDFGGTKHWMPAYPFAAILAGVGASRMAESVSSALNRLPPKTVQFLLMLFLLAPCVQQTITSHPYGLASYVPLIGGARGAATLGMTRQFWGYTTMGVAGWLNDNVPEQGAVFFHDTSAPAVDMFLEERDIRSDIRSSNIKRSDFALVHHELHMVLVEAQIWNEYKTHIPAHVLTYQGVPLVSVYQRLSGPRNEGK